MSFSESEKIEIERIMDAYLEKTRPPVHIRDKVDVGYQIENQSIEIFEIRPAFRNPELKIKPPIAKTTYVKQAKKWKLYWMRADLKWHRYDPVPEAKSLENVLKVIEEDAHGCFKG